TCTVTTGIITVTAPLGAGFEYSLDGGTYQASPTFNTVAAGPHTVTVRSTTDNTCVSTAANTTLNAATLPATPTLDVTQPTCTVTTGIITVTAPLGAGFEYSLDGGTYQASPTFNTVAAGPHSVTVRSATDNTCVSAAANTTLNAATPPAAPTLAATQPTCTVTTATITITSPTAGLTFSIDGGAFDVYPAGGYTVGSGPHTVTAQNADGCTASSNITVGTAPGAPAAPVTQVVNPTCTVATGT